MTAVKNALAMLAVLRDASAFQVVLPLSLQPQAHLADDSSFEAYAAAFGREYEPTEFELREQMFKKTVHVMKKHNSRAGRLWTAGLNGLSDRTSDELAQLRGWKNARRGSSATALELVTKPQSSSSTPLPEQVSWTNLTSYKHAADQGSCGSCWAVATITMMEARHEVQAKATRTFSAQKLVDCVPNPKECGGTGGCGGATVELALEYVETLTGARLDSAEETPYLGKDSTCSKVSLADVTSAGDDVADTDRSSSMSSWQTLTSNKAEPLMAALVDGPVAVAAAADMWFMYSTGIFDSCGKDAVIDHAVVMVGFGTDGSSNYWNIRNSWGASWGEGGYIRLFRHSTPAEDNAYCGKDYRPEEGMSCKPYPESVNVCGMCGVLYDSVIADFQSTSSSSATATKSTFLANQI